MSIGSVNVPGSIGAGRVINTNILDNSRFQINQRDGKIVKPNVPYFTDIGLTQQSGVTSSYMKVTPASNVWAVSVDGSIYYVSGAHVLNGYVGQGYTADRWFLWESDTVAVLVSDGIKVFRNEGSSRIPWLTQKFEVNTLQPGTYTFSVLSTNGVAQLNACIAEIGDILNYSIDEQFATATFIVPNTVIDKSAWVSIMGKSDSAIIAAKLELGPVQTLAHKEGDTWVLNDPPPDPALEKMKCQRYQYVIGSNDFTDIGWYQCRDAGSIALHINLPVQMRNTPAISGFYGNAVKNGPGGIAYMAINPAVITRKSLFGNTLALAIKCPEAMPGDYGWVQLDPNVFVVLDANL